MSEDNLVKVVVGPRGQLVSLDIDPYAYAYLDPVELGDVIVAATREAAEQALARGHELLAEYLPVDAYPPAHGETDISSALLKTDTDLVGDDIRSVDDGSAVPSQWRADGFGGYTAVVRVDVPDGQEYFQGPAAGQGQWHDTPGRADVHALLPGGGQQVLMLGHQVTGTHLDPNLVWGTRPEFRDG